MKNPLRLAITALGRRAVLSRRSIKDPRLAIGAPQDIHQDFIQAVIDFCDDGKSVQVITINGVPAYEIEVRKIEAAIPKP